MAELKDSGERRAFETGAVRDISLGKGRMDLLPLKQLSEYFGWLAESPRDEFQEADIRLLAASKILADLGDFIYTGDRTRVFNAIQEFSKILPEEIPEGVLTLKDGACPKTRGVWSQSLAASKQMEDGARKYKARNFEKGMPTHCFVDSGIRHLLKWVDKMEDEPHSRAFLWNLWALLFTLDNHPELNDLPFSGNEE